MTVTKQEIVLLSPEHHVCIFSSFAGSQKKIALSQKCGPNLHALCWNLAYCNIEDQRSVLSFHRRAGGGGGGQGGQLPPQFGQNISYSGNLYSRVGQSSCSCFVSVIFLIFSFHLSLAPCIKTHTKMQEMALKRLYFSKFSWGCPQTLLDVLAPLTRVGQIHVCPPKISKPVRLCKFPIVKVECQLIR